MSVQVENNVEKLLQEFDKNLRRPLPGILKQIARAEAVSFARSTQPYTSGEDWDSSQKAGRAKVEKDIRKLYATKGQVFLGIKRQDEGLADAFYYFFQIGKISGKRGAQALMDASKTSFVGIPIETFNPVIHQESRGNRGRVVGHTKQIVRNDNQLKAYITKKQKMVGYVKGGWAACARLLGGVRGIPGWVTRQKSRGSVSDQSAATENPYIIIHNLVPYANEALPAAAEAEALKSAHDRLTLMVEKAKEAAVKRAAQ